MNWMGLVAGVCWAFLGAGGASVVWGWWMRREMRRAVRRARAAECRTIGAACDRRKNMWGRRGTSRGFLENITEHLESRAELIEKGRA